MKCSALTPSVPAGVIEANGGSSLSRFLNPVAFLWLLLWLNLNSGPWNLSDRGWPWGYFNALRASLPFVILAALAALGWCVGTRPRTNGRESLLYLKVYSLIGLGAGLLSPMPSVALYF